MISKLFATIILTILTTGLFAQNIGTIVLTDAGSGEQYELSRLRSAKGAAIVFFGNRCAYNRYYIGRLKKLAEEFTPQGIRLILVNANHSDVIIEESPDNMKLFLDQHELEVPYLIDNKQLLKNTLGATRSPEVFLLNSKLEVFYSGAIDDSPQSEGDVGHPYLKEAILSLLRNETPAVNRARPAGCLIR